MLSDDEIKNINVPVLSKSGLIFLWVINCKLPLCFDLLEYWGYAYYDSIDWIKTTSNEHLACSNGYMVYHAKETCFIGIKGDFMFNKEKLVKCFFEERGHQSVKPIKMYEIIEAMVPNGSYIELFGRKNNLRTKWITIGNELN